MNSNQEKPKNLSRRDFLKGVSIGASALTASSMLAGCSPKDASTMPSEEASSGASATSSCDPWYGSAPEISESEIVEVIDTELLICGAGHAGMLAALTAAEEGIQTLVIEKGATVGEIKSFLGVINSKVQLEAGAEIDKTEAINELARYASSHCNYRLLKLYADESGEAADWLAGILADEGFDYIAVSDVGDGMHGIYKSYPTETNFIAPEGGKVEESVVAKAIEWGAEFRFSTPMVKLLREADNTGKVIGAIAQNGDGGYIKINASEGVLLCTGGYESDLELYNQLSPYAANVTSLITTWPTNTGDGIKAGIWAGGVKDIEPTAMVFDRGAIQPGKTSGYPFAEQGLMNTFFLGSQPFMKVNLDGERFCNESSPYDWPIFATGYQKGGVWISLFDANYWEHMNAFHTLGCSRREGEPGLARTNAEIDAFLESGKLQKADTLEELAEKLMIPADALIASVKRYNQFAEQGVDEDFGKPAKDLLPLDTAPFYGCTVGGALLCTLDGLQINEHIQVLDADRNVIEGLYAAGNVAGGFFAHNYPELFVGVASGRSMTFARHAVLHMIGKK